MVSAARRSSGDQSKAYLFEQPWWSHLYGRLPVCIRRCLARLEDWTEVSKDKSESASHRYGSTTYVGEPLSASLMLAVVRLLAGVRAGVHRQGAPLDEALAAVRVVALVWPLVGVYPIVSLQIRLAVEAL